MAIRSILFTPNKDEITAFPEEAKYADTDYAARAYGISADNKGSDFRDGSR